MPVFRGLGFDTWPRSETDPFTGFDDLRSEPDEEILEPDEVDEEIQAEIKAWREEEASQAYNNFLNIEHLADSTQKVTTSLGARRTLDWSDESEGPLVPPKLGKYNPIPG